MAAISPHLDEALEMTEGQRSTWLSSLQTVNPILASNWNYSFRNIACCVRRVFSKPWNCRVKLPVQDIFGTYTLITQIGHGGMGTVWLAQFNDERFDRRVAVKVLNVALMGKGGEERFRREGCILGRLTHPHIAN